MLTDKDHEDWSNRLGKRFRISGRIVRHIRNVARNKYPGLGFEDIKVKLVSEAKKAAHDIKRSNKPLIIEAVHLLTKDIDGINSARKVTQAVPPMMVHVLGGIDMLGFREGIYRFTKRMTEEQFQKIVADIPDPVEVKNG